MTWKCRNKWSTPKATLPKRWQKWSPILQSMMNSKLASKSKKPGTKKWASKTTSSWVTWSSLKTESFAKFYKNPIPKLQKKNWGISTWREKAGLSRSTSKSVVSGIRTGNSTIASSPTAMHLWRRSWRYSKVWHLRKICLRFGLQKYQRWNTWKWTTMK